LQGHPGRPCFLHVCRHASQLPLSHLSSSQILMKLFQRKADITREDARTEFAHYTRFCPKNTKVGKAVEYATSWTYGCPKTDLELLESLASCCRAAGHDLTVYRMTSKQARDVVIAKGQLEYEQRVRAAKRDAAKKKHTATPEMPPFDIDGVRRRYVFGGCSRAFVRGAAHSTGRLRRPTPPPSPQPTPPPKLRRRRQNHHHFAGCTGPSPSVKGLCTCEVCK
jgi:hypothetical protein